MQHWTRTGTLSIVKPGLQYCTVPTNEHIFWLNKFLHVTVVVVRVVVRVVVDKVLDDKSWLLCVYGLRQ